tara:strand:- start:323 stop:535 length:213 start_codon:yes stop_codon:yes gene_type:complete
LGKGRTWALGKGRTWSTLPGPEGQELSANLQGVQEFPTGTANTFPSAVSALFQSRLKQHDQKELGEDGIF